MDSQQLERFIHRIPALSKAFAGCLAIDQLPEKPIEIFPSAIIINSCARHIISNLCHWSCVWIDEEKVYIFDSGSAKTSLDHYKPIRDFCLRQRKNIVGNSLQIQPNSSVNCGLFVLTFLFAMSRNVDFERYLNCFSTENLYQNDSIVEKLFLCAFTKQQPNCLKNSLTPPEGSEKKKERAEENECSVKIQKG